MRNLLTILALSIATISTAQSLPMETSGFSHPESVCQADQVLFVSNIGATLDLPGKDGDGFISKVDLSTRRITELRFLSSLDAPRGLALQGRTLYISDIDHILGFDIDTRKKVLDLPVPGTHFLNDLAIGGGKLYASASDNGKVYEVDLQSQVCRALPLSDSITGANGLCYDSAARRLFCVGIGTWGSNDGRVFAIDLGTYAVTSISGYRGLLDGVDRLGNTLYFSDWKGMQDPRGVIIALDLTTHQTSTLSFARGTVGGLADFSISQDHKYFIIPATIEGKVLYVPVR
jgi:hypothetical protein